MARKAAETLGKQTKGHSGYFCDLVLLSKTALFSSVGKQAFREQIKSHTRQVSRAGSSSAVISTTR